jgi:hypothetical protein
MSMALGTMRSCSRACTRLEQQNHQPRTVAQHGGKQQASRPPSTKLAAAATDVQHSESSSFSGLTTQQVEQFHEDGFLALPGFASHEQVRPTCQHQTCTSDLSDQAGLLFYQVTCLIVVCVNTCPVAALYSLSMLPVAAHHACCT